MLASPLDMGRDQTRIDTMAVADHLMLHELTHTFPAETLDEPEGSCYGKYIKSLRLTSVPMTELGCLAQVGQISSSATWHERELPLRTQVRENRSAHCRFLHD